MYASERRPPSPDHAFINPWEVPGVLAAGWLGGWLAGRLGGWVAGVWVAWWMEGWVSGLPSGWVARWLGGRV